MSYEYNSFTEAGKWIMIAVVVLLVWGIVAVQMGWIKYP